MRKSRNLENYAAGSDTEGLATAFENFLKIRWFDPSIRACSSSEFLSSIHPTLCRLDPSVTSSRSAIRCRVELLAQARRFFRILRAISGK